MDTPPSDLSPFSRSVVYLGLCSAVLFTAYSPSQSFAATLQPDYGFASLAVLYFFFGISSIVAPSIIQVLGVRMSMTISVLGYSAYIFSLVTNGPFLLLFASALCGIGAALLWIANGMFMNGIAEEAKRAKGYFMGLFTSVDACAGVSGFLLSGLLLSTGFSETVMVFALTVISGFSFVMFFFSRDIPLSDTDRKQTMNENLHGMWALFSSDVRLQLLLVYILFMGMNNCVSTGSFPTIIGQRLGANYIPYVSCTYGAGRITFSVLWGKVYDSRGWKYVFYPQMCMSLVLYVVVLLSENVVIMFVVGLFFGITDGAINVTVGALSLAIWPTQSKHVFAVSKVISAGGTTIAFLVRIFTSSLIVHIIGGSFGVCAIAGFVYLSTLPEFVNALRPENKVTEAPPSNTISVQMINLAPTNGTPAAVTPISCLSDDDTPIEHAGEMASLSTSVSTPAISRSHESRS
eukprot:TRINITY_DN2120_c0_g1_i1.p1 TRINITY_DN2120_c0_g1~~TRINITY_DN2120_c0_g1_i1.p1  ORF type:complete len:462 (-),score=60.23 TRINITY_DN2120_c0_g1_i1:40-1425(-)